MLRQGIVAFAWLAVLAGDLPAHEPFRILVFSKTAGFRHDSIPDGIAAIQALGAAEHFGVDTTEDAARFTDEDLAQYACVVFLCTTGDVLDVPQQDAFERYIGSGKGYVGVHSASDTEYTWPWYGELIGAFFSGHPAVQQATIRVADRFHPSTAGLPSRWQRTDEWYNFNTNPRGRVHVLATLDEQSYTGGSMGFDHPIAWCRLYAGGRAWYTGGGHTQASYTEPLFRQHLLGGILWAAGQAAGDAGATVESNYQAVVLDDNIDNPMELAVAADGRVFFIEREGRLKIWRPQTHSTVLAGEIPVATPNEDGLLGLALDPGFAANGWLYLYYSPAGPTPIQRVSRFTVAGELIEPGSEQILLEIPTQREVCCHSAGSMAFGPDGNLYIATGDNTSPFETDYTPIDERPGRSNWDAQKSASNRNDLRGKILRISPAPDGTYAIPSGNLFPADGSQGRPEVYVMGCRNPFRLALDALTGTLYWGEPGPDAWTASAERGPAGLDEINRATAAGNFGWPYCIGPNRPYVDYDFASGASGGAFDCASPVNNSPNNTGAQSLPPSQPSLIHYPYDPWDTYPELGEGPRAAMAGPVYHHDPALNSPRKLPLYYDRALFIFDFSRRWIREVKFDDGGELLVINPFLPGLAINQPIDLELGPDGALYLLEWGLGAGHNGDARLRRIEYVASGAFAPTAVAVAEPSSGAVPLIVQFSGSASSVPDGDTLTYAWDFDDNGTVDSAEPDPMHTYADAGNFTARLTVTDPDGNTGVATVPISAGNTRPVVEFTVPPDGAFFNWGDQVPFEISAVDAEDGATHGTIACTRLTTTHLIGHDDHAHPQSQYPGCSGTVGVFVNPGHGDGEDLYLVLQSEYTDDGAPNLVPLTGIATRTLRPKLVQAESCSAVSGVQTIATADTAGGHLDLTGIDDGDWIRLDAVSLAGITDVSYRIGALGVGGRIEVRAGSSTGSVLSVVDVPAAGTSSLYTGVAAPILDPGGTNPLVFLFVGTAGTANLFNLNWIDFIGPGAASGSLNALAAVAVSPASIERAYRGAPPPPSTVTVTNAGQRTLNYTLTSDAPWLEVYPAAGSSTGEPDTFSLRYHTAGLPVGRHETVLRVADPAATNSPLLVPIVLEHLARSDLDADGDVDGIDFILFRICTSGDTVPAAADCLGRDLDADGDVDAGDFAIFQRCVSGEDRPPTPHCESAAP